MNFLCGLGVAESHCCHIFKNGHFHSTVAPIQQSYQGPGVHWPVQDGGSDTCVHKREKRYKVLRVEMN